MWADGSKWLFNNLWAGYKKELFIGRCLLLSPEISQWKPAVCDNWSCVPICQTAPTRVKGKSKISLNFTRDQLNFPSFHVWYKFQITDQQQLDNMKGKINTGFRLKWFIQNKNKAQVERSLTLTSWKPVEERRFFEHQTLLLASINKAYEARLPNFTGEQTEKNEISLAIERASDTHQYQGRVLCNIKEQMKGEEYRGVVLAPEGKNAENTKISSYNEKDLEIGFRIFLANTYCPNDKVVQVYLFLKNLLANNNTRTIIQGVVNLAKSESVQGTTIRRMVYKFYQSFDSAMGQLEYGKNLVVTSSRAELQSMIDKEYPFFMRHRMDIQTCLNIGSCQAVENILRNISKWQNVRIYLNI